MSVLPTILVVISINIFLLSVQARVEFTNAVCISNNKQKINIDHCRLKSVSRTYKHFSLTIHFYKYEPICNSTVNISLFKKSNGYRPFLYNVTIDACQYMRTRGNPVMRYLHSWFEAYSNINHTCPYGLHDILVDRLPISHVNNKITDVLPIPAGEYMLLSKWFVERVIWATVKLYTTFS